MATIKHSLYYPNMSAQQSLRTFMNYLTITQTKVGAMWEAVYVNDSEPNNEFGPLPIVYILKHNLDAANTAPMYAKIVMTATDISVLTSADYSAATDNNENLVLKGSWKSNLETDNNTVQVFNHASALVTPAVALTPQVRFPNGFNPLTQRFAKVWMIRRLGPKLDEVTPRKLTDIYGWMTFCTEEEGTNPIDTRGYYNHFGFGVAGDSLVPDVTLKNGAGIYAVAGSFSGESRANATATRVFAGGGSSGEANANIGCVMSAGKTGPWSDTTKPTWFYANTQYGYCRSPFDDDKLVGANNVGFDFTELCKYSPYSGVRTLTPAYIYGHYDNLNRILGRIPVIYTSLEGLYAGDMISQDKEGVIKNFMIFPFWLYRCGNEPENRLGYAIHVPSDEEV